MAQNVTVAGASYTDVPKVELPKTSGGTATFIDEDEIVTYYTGSSTPSAAIGNDGDIYLQTSS